MEIWNKVKILIYIGALLTNVDLKVGYKAYEEWRLTEM